MFAESGEAGATDVSAGAPGGAEHMIYTITTLVVIDPAFWPEFI